MRPLYTGQTLTFRITFTRLNIRKPSATFSSDKALFNNDEPKATLTMKTPTTIVNYVHDWLRENILSGHYPPGTRLNESLIARELKISRIPVREALVRLRESGLVMKHDRRGMFVIELTEEDIQRINSVRIILEAEALKLCQINMTKKQAAKLKELVDKMEKWDSTSEIDAADIDIEFHRTLWETAGNPYLANTLDTLSTALFAHAALQHVNTETSTWQLHHHRNLLNVALGLSSISAEEAVINHLKVYYGEPEKFSSLTKKENDNKAAPKKAK